MEGRRGLIVTRHHKGRRSNKVNTEMVSHETHLAQNQTNVVKRHVTACAKQTSDLLDIHLQPFEKACELKGLNCFDFMTIINI